MSAPTKDVLISLELFSKDNSMRKHHRNLFASRSPLTSNVALVKIHYALHVDITFTRGNLQSLGDSMNESMSSMHWC